MVPPQGDHRSDRTKRRAPFPFGKRCEERRTGVKDVSPSHLCSLARKVRSTFRADEHRGAKLLCASRISRREMLPGTISRREIVPKEHSTAELCCATSHRREGRESFSPVLLSSVLRSKTEQRAAERSSAARRSQR